MTTVLELARRVVEEAPESYYRFDRTLGRMQSFCQQFVGNMLTEAGVAYSGSYPSADAARADSHIYTTDWREASPGDIIYLAPNHVGIYEGDGFMLSATGWSTNAVLALGKAVYRHRVDDYARHLRLVGFSRTNGDRPPFPRLTPAGGGVTPFEEDDMQLIRYIFDGHRAGHDDSKHPDFGSTGVMWPWGFTRTSKGLGPRGTYEAAGAAAGASGIPVKDIHGDINLLTILMANTPSGGSVDASEVAAAVEGVLRDDFAALARTVAASDDAEHTQILTAVKGLPDATRKAIATALGNG